MSNIQHSNYPSKTLDSSSRTMDFSSRNMVSGPICKVPFDVLQEIFIFIHCLPTWYYMQLQPNTTTAPWLLCHVCSSWRIVARQSPVLWAHLHCRLTYYEDGTQSGLVKEKVEFIRWWKKNQGSRAPFVHISLSWRAGRPFTGEELDKDGMSFLLDYLTSARYLELDPFVWGQIQKRLKAGTQSPFSNLRGLIRQGYREEPDYFYLVQAITPTYTLFPALRHLSIHDNNLPPKNISQIPTHWSTLTHISLLRISISLNYWLSLIRSVPNLECGYVAIDRLKIDRDVNLPPRNASYTLHHLSTFEIRIQDTQFQYSHSAIQFRWLFTNLYLPSLRTLSLYWSIEGTLAFGNSIVPIDDLYAVLKATPAVTALTIGGLFLTLAKRHPSTMIPQGRFQPIWNHIPQLEILNLQFAFHGQTAPDVEAAINGFLQDTLFSDDTWVGLQHPACPILEITILSDESLLILLSMERFAELVISCIRKHVKDTSDIDFGVAQGYGSYEGSAQSSWTEWDSSI